MPGPECVYVGVCVHVCVHVCFLLVISQKQWSSPWNTGLPSSRLFLIWTNAMVGFNCSVLPLSFFSLKKRGAWGVQTDIASNWYFWVQTEGDKPFYSSNGETNVLCQQPWRWNVPRVVLPADKLWNLWGGRGAGIKGRQSQGGSAGAGHLWWRLWTIQPQGGPGGKQVNLDCSTIFSGVKHVNRDWRMEMHASH